MGREWYRGGSRSFSKGNANADTEPPSHGCMTAFRQLFDFHPLHHAMKQNSAPVKLDSVFRARLGGSRSLRDRLQLEDAAIATSAPSSTIREDSKIQMGIRIKTRKDAKAEAKTEADLNLCPETRSSSPRTKTPSVVARLMGLDLLPEDPASPSLSLASCNSHLIRHGLVNGKGIRPNSHRRRFMQHEDVRKSRSLPETPRISAERRSDVDHRLSLQITNKENICSGEEIFLRKNLMEKVKERRLGDDLTNTIRRSENREQRAHRCTKSSKESVSSTCSPRLGESNYKVQAPQLQHRKMSASVEKISPLIGIPYESNLRRREKEPEVRRKPYHRERFGQRMMKKPPQALEVQENPTVKFKGERNCKRIPLSNQQIINPKSIISIKKEPSPNAPPPQQHQEDHKDHRVEDNFLNIERFQRSSTPSTAPPNPIHGCNQKLVLDLIDEILGNFWTSTRRSVSAKVGNSPSADCRVLEDIDALIDWDFRHPMVQPWKRDYDDEWEAMFVEIEKSIVDWLVHETAAVAAPSYGLREGRFGGNDGGHCSRDQNPSYVG